MAWDPSKNHPPTTTLTQPGHRNRRRTCPRPRPEPTRLNRLVRRRDLEHFDGATLPYPGQSWWLFPGSLHRWYTPVLYNPPKWQGKIPLLYHLYNIANWVDYMVPTTGTYIPPIKGTRKLHWGRADTSLRPTRFQTRQNRDFPLNLTGCLKDPGCDIMAYEICPES